MKKYQNVYPFEIMHLIEEGKEIYMLDKELLRVFCVNCLTFGEVVKMLKVVDKDSRYEFWYAVEEEAEDGKL